MQFIEWVKRKVVYQGDNGYKELTNNYTTKDGILAILVFPAYIVFFYLGIRIHIHLGENIVSIIGNAAGVLLVFVILYLRRQKLCTVGISKNSWLKSSIIGFLLGVTYFILRVVGIIPASLQVMDGHNLAFVIFFYFVVISFSEEFVFRGYMQTRIYGIIKSDFWAVVCVGFLFALLHIIADIMLLRYFGDYGFVLRYTPVVWNLVQITIIHALINYFYRRYNSLAGPVILHGFLNLNLY